MSLYFEVEGSRGYWLAAVIITAFTVSYAWTGGMRASLLTDRLQTIMMFALLGIVLVVLLPSLESHGVPSVDAVTWDAGLTFCGSRSFRSYPIRFTIRCSQRGFLNPPRDMLKSFWIAAVLSGGAIFRFGVIGLYGRAFDLPANSSISVPASFGLGMMLLFNGIMLLSGGSTIDSTFTSVAKLTARDWRSDWSEPGLDHLTAGCIAIVTVAVLGNLPLLTIYLGDKVGPAIIAATTISGTMVMGLAPIFLLSWLRPAGSLSFHLAYWPGVAIGVARAIETFAQMTVFSTAFSLGSGKFAIDLGLNVWGLMICTIGYLVGAMLERRKPELLPDGISI